jgi:hypothetical protein
MVGYRALRDRFLADRLAGRAAPGRRARRHRLARRPRFRNGPWLPIDPARVSKA